MTLTISLYKQDPCPCGLPAMWTGTHVPHECPWGLFLPGALHRAQYYPQPYTPSPQTKDEIRRNLELSGAHVGLVLSVGCVGEYDVISWEGQASTTRTVWAPTCVLWASGCDALFPQATRGVRDKVEEFSRLKIPTTSSNHSTWHLVIGGLLLSALLQRPCKIFLAACPLTATLMGLT